MRNHLFGGDGARAERGQLGAQWHEEVIVLGLVVLVCVCVCVCVCGVGACGPVWCGWV